MMMIKYDLCKGMLVFMYNTMMKKKNTLNQANGVLMLILKNNSQSSTFVSILMLIRSNEKESARGRDANGETLPHLPSLTVTDGTPQQGPPMPRRFFERVNRLDKNI